MLRRAREDKRFRTPTALDTLWKLERLPDDLRLEVAECYLAEQGDNTPYDVRQFLNEQPPPIRKIAYSWSKLDSHQRDAGSAWTEAMEKFLFAEEDLLADEMQLLESGAVSRLRVANRPAAEIYALWQRAHRKQTRNSTPSGALGSTHRHRIRR